MVGRSLPRNYDPDTVEVTVNPDTLEVTLPYLVSGAQIQSAAGAGTELAPCQNSRAMQVLPISGEIELAHSSVPEVHLQVQSRPDLNQEENLDLTCPSHSPQEVCLGFLYTGSLVCPR